MRDQRPETGVALVLCTSAFAILAWIYCSGCGASALETHTRVAVTLHTGINESADVIEQMQTSRIAELRTAEGTAGEIEARGQAIIASFEGVRRVQGALAEAHALYVDAILIGVNEGIDVMKLIRMLGNIVDMYGEVAAMVQELGGELPELPADIVQLLGGA
jgi:hypothetical protein